MTIGSANQMALHALIEAALDQPAPTKSLVWALNQALTVTKHRDRDLSRDPSLANRKREGSIAVPRAANDVVADGNQ